MNSEKENPSPSDTQVHLKIVGNCSGQSIEQTLTVTPDRHHEPKAKLFRALLPSPKEYLFNSTELGNLLKVKAMATCTRVRERSFIPCKCLTITESSFVYSSSNHVVHNCLSKDARVAKVQNSVFIENIFQRIDLSPSHGSTESQCTLTTENKLAFIIGKRAIGKTTLTNVIVRKIVNECLYHAEYIVYVQTKWIKHERMSFTKLLLSSNFDTEFDSFQNEHISLQTLEKSSNLIIVIDGFDEVSTFPDPVELNAGTDAFPEEFVMNMVAGNLLPNAKKLIVLRPDQLQHLLNYLKCTYFTVLSLQGINQESKSNICQFICKETSAKASCCVSKDEMTSALCSNPLNCIIIMQCLNILMESNLEIKQFDSVTSIYVTMLELLIESCQNVLDFKLESLLNFAWYEIVSQNDRSNREISNPNIIFDCISKSVSSLTILEKLPSKIVFKHALLIDFFAAIQLSLFTTAEELNANLCLIPTNRFKSIGKFIFGLERPDILYRVNRSLEGIVTKRTLKENSLVCDKFLRKSKLLSHDPQYPLFKLLEICDYICESKKHSLCSIIPEHSKLPGRKYVFTRFAGVIPSAEYAGLQYVLSVIRDKIILIDQPQFLEDGFFQFFDNILYFPNYITIILKSIFINQQVCLSQKEVQCFSNCVKRFLVIEKLQISINSLDDRGLTLILESIKQRKTAIKQLCLSDIASGRVFKLIEMCLSQVKKLELRMLKEEQLHIGREFQIFCKNVKKLKNPPEMLVL